MLTLVSLIIGSSFAASWTVNADGSGDQPTIQDAIDAAAEGDSILLSEGEFHAPFDLSGKTINIIGAGRSETVIDGRGEVDRMIFAPPGTEAHRQYQSLLDNFEAYRRANEDS